MANAMRGKGGRRYRPDDFIPNWSGRRRRQTPEQMLAAAKQINRALGGKDRRRA